MNDKTDLIYDLVSKIDERQRDKAASDEKRHAKEDQRMANIESDLKDHKSSYEVDRNILYSLQEDKVFRQRFRGGFIKTVAVLASIGSIAIAIGKIL